VALLVVGMPLYNAVIHTFTTVATGGFSPKTASIAFYDSLAVEAIIVFFMAASGISFSLYYLLYTRRRLDVVLDLELLAYLGIIVVAVFPVRRAGLRGGLRGLHRPGAAGFGLHDIEHHYDDRVRNRGLRSVGHVRQDHARAADVRWGLRRLDGGGIKVIRIMIFFCTTLQDVFRMVHPRAITLLQIGGRVVPEGDRIAVLGLFAVWLLTFGLACFLVALQEELTLTSSVTAVATTLNDVGLGPGQVGTSESFEIVDPFGRVVLTVCMLLGRLEIFTGLALLSPAFWKR
jgi:trk system potassium uptake protein